MEYVEFKELLGKTFIEVTKIDDYEIHFLTDEKVGYKLYHENDCCEVVHIEDICGDLEDLVGTPILQADEVSSNEKSDILPDSFKIMQVEKVLNKGTEDEDEDDTHTEWTFYKLRTIKGSVTIRWYGNSEYYSIAVNLVRKEEGD